MAGRVGAMKRVPEPELMERDEQARAYAFADFEEPHARFIDLLLDRLDDLPKRGVALDLGCGPADVSIRLARALPAWSVDGIDGSAAMLHYGQEAVEAAGLRDRVQLVEARLPLAKPPRESYDLIFSNSLLHHLADPMVLWTAISQWPATAVFVMDLLRPLDSAQAQRLVDEHIAGEPEVLQRDFHRSLFAAYTLEEVRTQLVDASLQHLQIEQVSDRHLIAWA